MSVFTVAIIIWGIYQLGVSLLKKDKQQAPGKVSGPLKFPDVRSIRKTLLETPQGSWREQIQQALEKSSRQVEEKEMFHTVRVEEIVGGGLTQGTGVTQGAKATPSCEGTLNPGTVESLGEKMPKGAQAMSNTSFTTTRRELIQGVVWAEVLGKPRALQPFRGPRS